MPRLAFGSEEAAIILAQDCKLRGEPFPVTVSSAKLREKAKERINDLEVQLKEIKDELERRTQEWHKEIKPLKDEKEEVVMQIEDAKRKLAALKGQPPAKKRKDYNDEL